MAKKLDLKAAARSRVAQSTADDAMLELFTGKPAKRVVVKLPLSLLDPNPDQEKYYPVHDGEYEAKAKSLAELGQIDPIHVVQAARGRYQILAGHRRVGGAKLLGWTEIDAIIDDVSPEVARAIFHATNLESQELSPSQRMRGYVAIEAALASEAQTNGELDIGRSTAAIAEQTGDDRRMIQRYKRLQNLHPDLLRRVDDGSITMRAAYDLSFLALEEQAQILEKLGTSEDSTITPKQATSLKNLSKSNLLSADRLARVMVPESDAVPLPTVKAPSPAAAVAAIKEKKSKGPRERQIKLPWSDLHMYFRPDATDAEVQQTIYDALDAYARGHDHEREVNLDVAETI